MKASGEADRPASVLDNETAAGMLRDWLPGQRWFAGKAREIAAVHPRLLARFGPEQSSVELWLAEVAYADGASETYQVPLGVLDRPDVGLAHAQVGEVGANGSVHHIYDALYDKSLTQLWLQGIHEQAEVGPVRFHLSADPDAVPLGSPSRVLAGEQSNTSAVFGDSAILKLFRRLEAGLNPDIEIHQALGRRGARNVATLLGYVTADGIDGAAFSLAMLQEFLSSATDGWELAKISVRDLMAEADLHAEEAGGDFAGEAFRLGEATAQVHAELGAEFGVVELDRSDLRRRADTMVSRLDSARGLVPQLNDVADRLGATYAAFAALEGMPAQRIHGDLHLGQVMRTVQRWVVLDFEGEPVKSIDERRAPDSPLRDVAGMMRSFDYAANHQVIDSGTTSQRAYRATEWSARNRDAFCLGYTHVSGADPRASAVLLRAFEADKAVYEAVYEARNRPAWLPVPLASLGRLTAPGPDDQEYSR